jgi:bifunctional enzyme CysN/CysC
MSAPPRRPGAPELASSALGANGVLRLVTCGAVDDGKSTLLGRLFADAGAVLEDHLASLKKRSEGRRIDHGELDYSLLFDGLESEREQAITIDVAYRYFMTARRKFIVADSPGHETHTRNMATAASNADVAIVLVDVRRGPSAQTFRHLQIAALVGVKAVIIAVNKMDMVAYAPERFRAITSEIEAACQSLRLSVFASIPVSAVCGDNIVVRANAMPWYAGATLIEAIETVDVAQDRVAAPLRFPIQMVMRPHDDLGGRGYSGVVASGRVEAGQDVLIAHWGVRARVVRIVSPDGDLTHASAGDAVTLVLEGDHDLSRGDVLADPGAPPLVATGFEADLVCLDEAGAPPGKRFELRVGPKAVSVTLENVIARIDHGGALGSGSQLGGLALNDIARCRFVLSRPIALDLFDDDPTTGGFLLVERNDGDTIAAGMIRSIVATNVRPHAATMRRVDRQALMGHRACVLWLTGLSGSGKSTIADCVERRLYELGAHTFILDGDNLRSGLNKDLGFSTVDRVENIRRTSEVARLFTDAGLIVICALISPFRADRAIARDILGDSNFLEIFVDAPLEVCAGRDPKGLYRRAIAGEIAEFTGVSSPYEPPLAPDLHLATDVASAEDCADLIVAELRRRGIA